MQEEENRILAAHNARLQQQIAELTDKAAMALQRAEDARRLSGVYEVGLCFLSTHNNVGRLRQPSEHGALPGSYCPPLHVRS